MIVIRLVMRVHLEVTRAAMLVGLEDQDREIMVIGDSLHRVERMPIEPPLVRHVNSVDRSTANASVNGGNPCPRQNVRPHEKGCKHVVKTHDVVIEIVARVVVDPNGHQINDRVSFCLIFVGPLALAHSPIQRSRLFAVVIDRGVQRTTVVPHNEVPRSPSVSIHRMIGERVLVEEAN